MHISGYLHFLYTPNTYTFDASEIFYFKNAALCYLSCLNRIIEENYGKTPLTYNRMQAIVKTLGPPKRPVPAPTMEDMKGTTNTGLFTEINTKTS